jgi:hypothetical protein
VVVNRKRDRGVVVVEVIRERCAVHELICDGGHFMEMRQRGAYNSGANNSHNNQWRSLSPLIFEPVG